MSAANTSMPRWGSAPPDLDLGGRSFTIISIGGDARGVARGWARAAVASGGEVSLYHDECDADAALDALRGQLAEAVVGWRLMICGPEDALLRLQAVALKAGALPAEIRAHSTSTADRRVHCAHCSAVTQARAPVGESVECGGCRRRLFVYHHVSRRLAAYLGYQVDAEEGGAPA